MYSLNEFLGGVISTLRTFRLRDLDRKSVV